MKITKTIELNIKRQGNKLIIGDLSTLIIVMGTTSVQGNLHCYGVTKQGTNYIVPIDSIKKQIKQMQNKIQHTQKRIQLMKQIIKGG